MKVTATKSFTRYITAGKEYEIIRTVDDNIVVVDDEGGEIGVNKRYFASKELSNPFEVNPFQVESPIDTAIKNQITGLTEFRQFIAKNSKRKAKSIRIDFQHPTFKDNEGFALLDGDANFLVNIIYNAIDAHIIELKKTL